MADSHQKSDQKTAPPKAKASGKSEFVAEGEDSYEKGYWGVRDNPHDDEEFSLQTGPNAPLQDLRGNAAVDPDGNEVDKDDHIQKAPKE